MRVGVFCGLGYRSPHWVDVGLATMAVVAASACSADAAQTQADEPDGGGPLDDVPVDPQSWSWVLPDAVEPPPAIPENPITLAKVELGRYLFYDKRLSGNETYSCATCHEQALAFTDGEAISTGSTGGRTSRGAPTIINSAYATYMTWSNLVLRDFESHALVPLFGDTPIEMGASYFQWEILERVAADEDYQVRFAEAFPGVAPDEQISWTTIIFAISSFQRALLSFAAPYDRWLDGDVDALSPAAERGRRLFFSDRLRCGDCHAGRLLSRAFPTSMYEKPASWDELFANTGLYNLDGHYPEQNPGIAEFTGDPGDDGRHRIPSLRNVGMTAPYMHDGSISSLDGVLDHYAAGGRTLDGEHAGVGADNPNKDPRVSGFDLSMPERTDLLAFLYCLSDEEVLENPRFADPFAP